MCIGSITGTYNSNIIILWHMLQTKTEIKQFFISVMTQWNLLMWLKGSLDTTLGASY